MIDQEFKREIESWAERIESDATVEEAINCLSVLNSARKRIDRIQADPRQASNATGDVYMNHKEKKLKKYLLALLAVAALTATSCSTLQQVALQSEGGDTQATTTTVETRIPGQWFLFPDETDPTRLCNGLYSTTPIPCKDVLNVFVEDANGNWTAKWMPEVFYHTENSPTWRDVCLTVDPSQWFFCDYTPEECAEA